ncbi:hypothetical protein OG225_26175 [Nocardia sp. NBC_01377]|uniref:hypothetical protein n=1 Tax=Nocardia sp. NBC_01377 TaxID=2903595 RepID=UPI003244EC11
MKRQFVTETHVAVYCDVCGICYGQDDFNGRAPGVVVSIDAQGIAVVFDSIARAVDHINAHPEQGWFYDGDRVLCDGCQRIERHDRDLTDLHTKD